MTKIQVYIHGENNREPKLIEIAENATVLEIIEAYLKEFPGTGNPQEIEIFLEDQDGPRQKDHDCQEAGIHKRGHIHCHRCNQIVVSIFYNGEDKPFHFPPATTGKTILKKAIHAFNISEADAGDYLLKLDDKTILLPSDHIGSFASYPHCQVKLFLTPTKPVQG